MSFYTYIYNCVITPSWQLMRAGYHTCFHMLYEEKNIYTCILDRFSMTFELINIDSWWLFWLMGSMHYNIIQSNVWIWRRTIFKNKSHLVTFHESVLVNLWTFQPSLIYCMYIQIYTKVYSHTYSIIHIFYIYIYIYMYVCIILFIQRSICLTFNFLKNSLSNQIDIQITIFNRITSWSTLQKYKEGKRKRKLS